VVVDWRIRRLVHRSRLNSVSHSGRAPRQSLGLEPQAMARVPVPWPVCCAGPVVGLEGAGGVGEFSREFLERMEVHHEDRLADRGHPAACGRVDMNRMGDGRRVLPDRRVHQPGRAVGAHGVSRGVHGPGCRSARKSGNGQVSRITERDPLDHGRYCASSLWVLLAAS
jgi:hypothetical protein